MKISISNSRGFLALLVRRKWWVIGPFLALMGASILLFYFLPKVFVSETLIVVRPQDVPEDFVRKMTSGSTEQRLKAIEQTVLSRNSLVSILEEFGSKMPEFDRLNMDQRVLKLRDQIRIVFDLQRSGGDTPVTYFRITYQDRDPVLAQKIATKLTTLFINQDNQNIEKQVNGATEFLQTEVDKMSVLLDESEAKLRKIRAGRMSELPSNLDANLRTLERLTLDRKTNSEDLDRSATKRLTLQQQIAETPEFIPKPIAPRPTLVPAPVVSGPPIAPVAPAPPPAPAFIEVPIEMMPNPVFRTLTGQLQLVETDLKILARAKEFIDGEITKYSRRVENTPRTEQEISAVLRENTDIRRQYDDLGAKLASAKLSESLVGKQKGQQFVIVDPANYPLDPEKPQKPLLAFGAGLLSLFLSIGVAVGVDVTRRRVWAPSEVEALWGVPVLEDIPSSPGTPALAPLYIIQPNDLLSVFVWKEPTLSTKMPVRPDGRISIPLVQDIQAAGLNPEELKLKIEESLKQYVEIPNVTVVVEALQSYRIFVTGKVAKPGAIMAEKPVSVLQALALAGGFTESAHSDETVIIRSAGGENTWFKFNYREVTRGRNTDQNMLLKSGDVVVVP